MKFQRGSDAMPDAITVKIESLSNKLTLSSPSGDYMKATGKISFREKEEVEDRERKRFILKKIRIL